VAGLIPPCARSELWTVRRARCDPTRPRRRGCSFVDDEETVLSTLAAVLRQNGCRVVEAHDRDTALSALRQRPFDVLVADLRIEGRPTVSSCWPKRAVISLRWYASP